jgi:hypothetical protein
MEGVTDAQTLLGYVQLFPTLNVSVHGNGVTSYHLSDNIYNTRIDLLNVSAHDKRVTSHHLSDNIYNRRIDLRMQNNFPVKRLNL